MEVRGKSPTLLSANIKPRTIKHLRSILHKIKTEMVLQKSTRISSQLEKVLIVQAAVTGVFYQIGWGIED